MYASLYQSSSTRQIEYWLETAPQAVVPTYGVHIDPPAGKSSCRCYRCQPGDTSAGKHPLHRWAGREEGMHRNALLSFLKSYQQDPTSVGWALATGRAGLAVVDVDPRNGGDLSLAELLNANGPFPSTPQDETGGGGWHWYFLAPKFAPSTVGKSSLQLAPGVELLTGNHLIQIPPSIHYTGHRYKWASAPWDTAFAPLPGWIASKLQDALTPQITPQQAKYARFEQVRDADERVRRARAYLAIVPGAISGQGGYAHTNATILKIVKGFGLTESDAGDVLGEWNLACQPPWKPAEIRAKIRWAYQSSTPDGFLLNARSRSRAGEKLPKISRIKIGDRVVGRRKLANPAEAAAATIDPCPGCGDLVNCRCHRWSFKSKLDDVRLAKFEPTPRTTKEDREASAIAAIALAKKNAPYCPRAVTIGRIRKFGGKYDINKAEREKAEKKAVADQLKATSRKHRNKSTGRLRSDVETDISSNLEDREWFNLYTPGCGCWSCESCSPLLRVAWSENFKCRIVEDQTYYMIECREEEQTKIAARIRRLKGKYFYIDTPEVYGDDLRYRLIVSDKPFPGSQPVNRDEALSHLSSCLETCSRRKPVGSSDGWNLPKVKKSKYPAITIFKIPGQLDDDVIYRRVEAAGARIEHAKVALAQRHKLMRKRTINIAGFSDDKIDRVIDALRSPITEYTIEPCRFDDSSGKPPNRLKIRMKRSVFDQSYSDNTV